ncbi:hypothetical protein ACH5RR_022749 [Cinchona calisaya]|uniref:F-box domain-containing protein n=1 Tax=Cinchona calisaya TaxID=153742 RepID=A0ABD2Z8N9_9GENT
MMNPLEEAILIEILVRLPIKSITRLARCTCICKLWCALIKSPDIAMQKLARIASVVLVKKFVKDVNKTVLSFHSCDEDKESLRILVPDLKESMTLERYWMDLVGTCNGIVCVSDIVCMSDMYFDIYLCNPVIHDFLKLLSCPLIYPDHCSPNNSSVTLERLAFGIDQSYTILNYKVPDRDPGEIARQINK